MTRNYNSNSNGNSFNATEVLAVWNKGRVIFGYSATEWRTDIRGNPIRYQDYGKTVSKYGWEIDHIFPVAYGGSDLLSNLQPLQWENNRRKGDTYPW